MTLQINTVDTETISISGDVACTLSYDGAGNWSGSSSIVAATVTAPTLVASLLTPGDIVYTGTGGRLSVSSNMTWNNSTQSLTVVGSIGATYVYGGNSAIQTSAITGTSAWFGNNGWNSATAASWAGMTADTTGGVQIQAKSAAVVGLYVSNVLIHSVSSTGNTLAGTTTLSALGTGILKATSGVVSVAAAGTDYLTPASVGLTSGYIAFGNGAGNVLTGTSAITTAGGGSLILSSTDNSYRSQVTGQPTDGKLWDIETTGTVMNFRLINDAQLAATIFASFGRSAMSFTGMTLNGLLSVTGTNTISVSSSGAFVHYNGSIGNESSLGFMFSDAAVNDAYWHNNTGALRLGTGGSGGLSTFVIGTPSAGAGVNGPFYSSSLSAGGMVKANTSGMLQIATAGTDYLTPSSIAQTQYAIVVGTGSGITSSNLFQVYNMDPAGFTIPNAQGNWLGWNRNAGQAEFDFVNNVGTGGYAGGFRWYKVSNGTWTSALMTLDGSGNLGTAATIYSPSTITAGNQVIASLASSTGAWSGYTGFNTASASTWAGYVAGSLGDLVLQATSGRAIYFQNAGGSAAFSIAGSLITAAQPILATANGFTSGLAALNLTSSYPAILLNNTGNATDTKIWRLVSTSNSFRIDSYNDAQNSALTPFVLTRTTSSTSINAFLYADTTTLSGSLTANSTGTAISAPNGGVTYGGHLTTGAALFSSSASLTATSPTMQTVTANGLTVTLPAPFAGGMFIFNLRGMISVTIAYGSSIIYNRGSLTSSYSYSSSNGSSIMFTSDGTYWFAGY